MTREIDPNNTCPWALGHDDNYLAYHDEEWGVPVTDDRVLFEFLVLESAQAGLSWATILGKREGYRDAFANFDPVVVAGFGDADVERLRGNAGIVRNLSKIRSAVSNARLFLDIQAVHGSFAAYLWSFVDGKPVVNHWKLQADCPATSELSDTFSKDLRQRGFKFVGSTTMYAFLQAVGVINDHLITCHRHAVCTALGETLHVS
ncbi:MAG: DNA-3-methyladenine glycosylase I [Pseudomonadota bacterium]